MELICVRPKEKTADEQNQPFSAPKSRIKTYSRKMKKKQRPMLKKTAA